MDVRSLDEDFMREIDYVVHLAFVTNIPNSINNPLDTTKDNIDMTVHLLNLCVNKIKKFLFPSTDHFMETTLFHGMKVCLLIQLNLTVFKS